LLGDAVREFSKHRESLSARLQLLDNALDEPQPCFRMLVLGSDMLLEITLF